MLKKTAAIILMILFIIEFTGAGAINTQIQQDNLELNNFNSNMKLDQKSSDLLAMTHQYFIEIRAAVIKGCPRCIIL